MPQVTIRAESCKSCGFRSRSLFRKKGWSKYRSPKVSVPQIP